MACLSPINIPKPNGTGSRDRIIVPCGKCVGCKQDYSRSWAVRLEYELKHSITAYFITLTYSDENITYGKQRPTLVKKDLQLFFKRYRTNYSETFRYYAVGEYGEKDQRPHYHILIFNLSTDKTQTHERMLRTWNNGIVHIGTVTRKSIYYCLKYMIKALDEDIEGVVKPFALMSRRPAIGLGYVETNRDWHEADIERTYVLQEGGTTVSLPRYYRNKLYSDAEREEQGRRSVLKKRLESYKHHDNHIKKNKSNYFKYVDDQKELMKKKVKQSKKRIL